MGDRRIDEDGPQPGEQQHCAELDALRERPGDQGRCKGGEQQLKEHKGLERNGRRIDRMRRGSDVDE
jgi:hypothetical protein